MRLPRGVRRLLRLGDVRPQVRRDVDEELGFHREEVVRALVERGLSEEEARAEARARFGDEVAYRRELERIDRSAARGRWWLGALDSTRRTVAFALRGVARSPGLALSIVVILALGIGANAVMFGVVDRLLLSPPQHVERADEVQLLYVRRQTRPGEIRVLSGMTYPDYQDFLEVEAFASVAGYTQSYPVVVGRGEEAHEARVASASPSLFSLLGVRPVIGRFFDGADDMEGATPTAILAQEYWERVYGSDPSVIGRTLDVGLTPHVIIGVAPAGFTGARLAPVDVWAPLTLREMELSGRPCLESRGCYWMETVARLAPGATPEAASAEATAVHRAARADLIARERYDADAEVLVAPIIAARGPVPTNESRVATWLAGVSLVVLLIACLNVANLLLARSIRARREVAVRLALGAGRGRLVTEIVAESVLLAALGAGAALALARLLEGSLHQLLLPNVAFADGGLGGRLLAFTLLVTVGAGLLAGVFPALQARRADVAEALKAGARTVAGQRSRTRLALIVGQATLSVLLLVGAGLFVRSLSAAERLDLGWEPSRTAFASFEWNAELSRDERGAVYERVLPSVRRVPGVRAAALTFTVPFYSTISVGPLRAPGVDSIPRHPSGGPYVNKVGSGYFEATGLEVLQGRGFQPDDDRADARPVVAVTESMARAIWPEGRAVGSCLMLGDEEDDPPCAEVVGVIENHRQDELVEDDLYLYFVNLAHPGFEGPPQGIMVGFDGDARTAVGELRQELRGAASEIRFVNASPLSDFVEPQLRAWRLGAWMFTAFGLMALVVAAWGLYSVLAFDVALRRHELGVRSALGAGVRRLVGMVVGRALVLVSVGVVIGLAVAVGAARFIEPLLFEISPRDPTVYVLVAAALVLAAGVAGVAPALRAARADAREALQAE